jgi:hypothetical protein
MENTDYAQSTKPSVDAVHGVECDPAERPTRVLYTRPIGGLAPAGTDINFYDLGIFTLATAGIASPGVTLGELWVSYDITFFKKVLPGASLGQVQEMVLFNSTVPQLGSQVISNIPYGPIGIPAPVPQTNSGYAGNRLCTVSVPVTGQDQTIFAPAGLPSGRYRITMLADGGSLILTGSPIGNTVNSTVINGSVLYPFNAFGSIQSAPAVFGGTRYYYSAWFDYIAPPASSSPAALIRLPFATGFFNVSFMEIIISLSGRTSTVPSV